MKRWSGHLVAAVAAWSCLLHAFGADITIQGSDTMVALAQKWAEGFMAFNSGVSIQVNGGGTGTGVAALLNRTADIATCSRKIRAREVEGYVKAYGARPAEYAVALDAVVLHVHESNPVRQLDLEQVAGLFTGRISNWREVGGPDIPVVLYGRDASSGTYEFFKDTALKGRDYAQNMQMLQGTAQVVAAVGQDRGGIGFCGGSLGGGTRKLRIAPMPESEPVAADEGSVRSGRYPLWRRLYIYLNPSVDIGPAHDWVEWIRGESGQGVVGELGFFPLKPAGK